ncbi:type II secretion system protein GspM [Cognatazoarcus halotolerans]|uniref:type II secretion system protein GspM n=1 Tax=Cognatazoarcus halotolerans TaxID=2686016 RepID=UPI00135A2260|nr:type II secretion system protein GspM [Cognatazoarcus halotolerans]MCB1901278.1 type II secretion system protein M [Rhodocyclaceae bacterium]MCP5311565.1 type II secretion system protein M [Zoogloeaceae bacterium]
MIVTQLKARLATLNPRERRLIGIATVVIATTLLLLLAEWSFSERARLDKRLPAAEAELARMQADAEELAQLRRLTPPAAATLAVRTQAARAAATARELDLVIDTDTNGLRISGTVQATALLDWLASMQSQQQLQVGEMSLRVAGDKIGVEGLLTPTATR